MKAQQQPLDDDFISDQQFISVSISSLKNRKGQTKPKFTLLDDLDEINQIINGPDAKEDQIVAENVLLKTYEYMKNSSNEGDPIGLPKSNQPAQMKGCKDQERGHCSHADKQNKDIINLNCLGNGELAEQMRNVKGPRIVITMKRINLLESPTSEHFHVEGLENMGSNSYSNAPRNSMREEEQENFNLFSKALKTDRKIVTLRGDHKKPEDFSKIIK